jgi:hypothetical protein
LLSLSCSLNRCTALLLSSLLFTGPFRRNVMTSDAALGLSAPVLHD